MTESSVSSNLVSAVICSICRDEHMPVLTCLETGYNDLVECCSEPPTTVYAGTVSEDGMALGAIGEESDNTWRQ
jgi:hypothetical protein